MSKYSIFLNLKRFGILAVISVFILSFFIIPKAFAAALPVAIGDVEQTGYGIETGQSYGIGGWFGIRSDWGQTDYSYFTGELEDITMKLRYKSDGGSTATYIQASIQVIYWANGNYENSFTVWSKPLAVQSGGDSVAKNYKFEFEPLDFSDYERPIFLLYARGFRGSIPEDYHDSTDHDLAYIYSLGSSSDNFHTTEPPYMDNCVAYGGSCDSVNDTYFIFNAVPPPPAISIDIPTEDQVFTSQPFDITGHIDNFPTGYKFYLLTYSLYDSSFEFHYPLIYSDDWDNDTFEWAVTIDGYSDGYYLIDDDSLTYTADVNIQLIPDTCSSILGIGCVPVVMRNTQQINFQISSSNQYPIYTGGSIGDTVAPDVEVPQVIPDTVPECAVSDYGEVGAVFCRVGRFLFTPSADVAKVFNERFDAVNQRFPFRQYNQLRSALLAGKMWADNPSSEAIDDELHVMLNNSEMFSFHMLPIDTFITTVGTTTWNFINDTIVAVVYFQFIVNSILLIVDTVKHM